MFDITSRGPKEPKPPKEKKVYYSSRGGARSKSLGPAVRKPVPTTGPSKLLEVPVPTNKTTSTGRGGFNGRTFVVEEGVFERVMDFEVAKIKEMKQGDEKRKTISLRGGAVVPKERSEKDIPRTSTRSTSSGQSTASGEDFSPKSLASKFPKVPALTGNLFSRDRDRPSTPVSAVPSSNGSIPSNGSRGSDSQSVRHCPTCQCWRHTMSTQVSVDAQPSSPQTQPPSPFRSVFPGVMLYVPPEELKTEPVPPSPTSASSVYSFYREVHSDFRTPTPEPRFSESNRR